MITIQKVLGIVYSDLMRDKLRRKNNRLASFDFNVAMSYDPNGNSAYTMPEKKLKYYRIVIGGRMIQSIASLPDEFKDKEEIKEHFQDILYAFYGLDYHEIGHLLFTDMLDTSIIEYPYVKYRGFLHILFNTMEDPIVEASMIYEFKEKFPFEINPKQFFDFMIRQIFLPQCAEYEDDGSVESFLHYLLLVLRCGKKAIPNTNAVWEKYQEGFYPLIKDILYEPNATERVHKTITLGEWIINNIKEFNWELPEPPEPKKLSGKGIPGTHTKSATAVKSEDKGSVEEKATEDSSTDTESKEDEEEPPELDETCPDFSDSFNDISEGADNHEWVIAKEEFDFQKDKDDETLLNKINSTIDEQEELILQISKFLNLFHSRIAPRNLSGFNRGKLDLKRAIQNDMQGKCDTTIFKHKVPLGESPDLAVTLVCDNSGSMSGTKSEICFQAALALAQSCEWSSIPFECLAFTKTYDGSEGTCITIKIKDFDDTFESSKPYFAINDSSLVRKLTSALYVPTFRGNSEEVNLYYIWKKLIDVKHKTKLVFVLCDGETTGSSEDLKSVVKNMEADGIVVVGIGICDSSVKNSYGTYKCFGSTEELEKDLAPYLIDTLSKYAI